MAAFVIMYYVASFRELNHNTTILRFDQGLNPHNDQQPQERAYRNIGQKRNVVLLYNLHEAVTGGSEKGSRAPERAMKSDADRKGGGYLWMCIHHIRKPGNLLRQLRAILLLSR